MEIVKFDFEESLAVVRLVWMLIFSNSEITRTESDYFQQTLKDLNVTQKEIEKYIEVPEEDTYELIRNMSYEKRMECVRLLRLAFSADKERNIKEMSKLNDMIVRAELFRSDINKNDDTQLV
jgi:uncharacterized tellurite resistance protein B-like protein